MAHIFNLDLGAINVQIGTSSCPTWEAMQSRKRLHFNGKDRPSTGVVIAAEKGKGLYVDGCSFEVFGFQLRISHKDLSIHTKL